MRVTYRPEATGRFVIDGEALEPGESAEVDEARGKYLLERHSDVLVAASPAPRPAGAAKEDAQAQGVTAPASSTIEKE